MKTISFLSLFLSILLISCNNGTQRKNTEKETALISVPASCYVYGLGNDSIVLNVEIEDNMVTGNLVYDFFEKDDNSGQLTGEMHGDTIFALYKFKSEGVTSQREVAFLKRGDTYVEGFGEMSEENGKMVFNEKKAVSFESDLVLKKINCPSFSNSKIKH